MSPLIIEIKNQQKKIKLNPSRIIKITKKFLCHLKIQRAQLSVAFVTDRKIKVINRKYLGHDYATDVLAFDLNDEVFSGISISPQGRRSIPSSLEGEIVISTVTACKNAKRFKTTPDQEILLYLAHGILHLVGFDDHFAKGIKKMRFKEKELMGLLGRLESKKYGVSRK